MEFLQVAANYVFMAALYYALIAYPILFLARRSRR